MSTIPIDIYRYHMHQRTEQGNDPVALYSACHDAVESNSCNTGASPAVQQGHRIPGGYDHEFTISRLGMFFYIDIPVGATISLATLKLRMRKYDNPVGEEDWDWTLSIRKNDTLAAPGGAGACPTEDFPKYLYGIQVASKYVDDLETFYADYELNTSPADIVPQTYLILGLVSSKDLAGEAPDSEVAHILEWTTFTGTPQLVLIYTTIKVETNPATLITRVSATLNGTLVFDGGEATDCGFEWGLTTAYGETTPTQSRTTGQTFAQDITSLIPDTVYHFRAIATNSTGTGYGEDRVFTTLSGQDSVDQTIIGNKVSLEAIRNLEIVYGGRFYISKSGSAIYESRYHRNV